LLHRYVACAIVRHHYHSFHPNVGIHLMKLGKIQLYTEQTASAAESLQQVSCSVNNVSVVGRKCP